MRNCLSLTASVYVLVECADLPALFRELAQNGVYVYELRYIHDLQAVFRISRKSYRFLKIIAEKKGATVRIKARSGLYWYILKLLYRPVLIVGMVIIIFLSVFVPGRILFIRVEGNVRIPDGYILECAERSGLSFGTDRHLVRSEKLKNRMLESIPQLQWIGVNSAGCVAVISVQERESAQEAEEEYALSSIIAERDGVIVSCTGTKGNVLCKPGQAVKRGDVLISGYTDCGFSIRAERAQGDIYAQTVRSLEVVSPILQVQKGRVLQKENKYAVVIGKKRINFYKDSGILTDGCDMIYEQYYIMLPGGFQLPVAIVKETWYTYDNSDVPVSENAVQTQTQQYAQNYLRSQMIGGQILATNISVNVEQGVCVMQGKYTCLEMIGRIRREEILEGNG